jgi:ATP-dependent Clp protease ATP-binding subunit ClpA
VLERFTDDVVLAIVSAREQARELGHDHVGTEHLLLGLLAANCSGVAPALARHEVTLAEARSRVCSLVTPTSGPPTSHPSFTASAKRALEWSLLESMQRRSASIAPEDVMLGVIHVDGTAVAVLIELEVDTGRLYDELKNQDLPDPDLDQLEVEDALAGAATELVTDMLRVSDDVTTLAIRALVASWVGNEEELETRLGALVSLVDYLGAERWLEQLGEMIEVLDPKSGKIRLRPKPDAER